MNELKKKKKYNLIKEPIKNVLVFYQGIQKIRQNNNKIIKITLFTFSNLLKTVYASFFSLMQNVLYSFFIFLIKVLTSLFSILKFPRFIKRQIHNKYFNFIFNLYLYNLKNLFKKRNALLRKTTKSIIRYHKRRFYRKKHLNHLITVQKMKFTEYGKKYFMRNVVKRRKFDEKLQKRSTIFTKILYKYYFIENAFYKAENKISYNILHLLSKGEYILHNLTKIINYFKNYKKLNLIRHIFNLYLDKFRNIISAINNRSVILKIFRRIDESFYELLVKRLYVVNHKRNKKRYLKYTVNSSVLKLFLVVYYSFKVIMIFNILFNNKMISLISGRLELLFSLQGIFNEYSRYLNIN